MLCLALLFGLAVVPMRANMSGTSTPDTTNPSGKVVTPSDSTVKSDNDIKGSDMKGSDMNMNKDKDAGINTDGSHAVKQLPDNVVK